MQIIRRYMLWNKRGWFVTSAETSAGVATYIDTFCKGSKTDLVIKRMPISLVGMRLIDHPEAIPEEFKGE